MVYVRDERGNGWSEMVTGEGGQVNRRKKIPMQFGKSVRIIWEEEKSGVGDKTKLK